MDTPNEMEQPNSDNPTNSTEELSKEEKQALANQERERQALVLKEQLANLDRTPFREVLADFLSCKPSQAQIQAFAAKNPDKWVQSLLMLGKLGNYTEKTPETTINLYQNLNLKSDAEVMVFIENEFSKAGLEIPDLRGMIQPRVRDITGESSVVAESTPSD